MYIIKEIIKESCIMFVCVAIALSRGSPLREDNHRSTLLNSFYTVVQQS